jgi:phage FluMu protein Com
MAANQEGIGVLKLECPQCHPVGRILKEAPHQAVQYDPGAQVGIRRFWPDEQDQPQFKIHCRFCDKSVGEATTALQNQLASLVDDTAQTIRTATLQYA